MADATANKPEVPKKKSKVRGQVLVNWEHCKGCAFCIEFCPKNVLELSKDFNKKGYHPPEIAHPEECNACNLCGLYCPDFAIFAAKVKSSEEDS